MIDELLIQSSLDKASEAWAECFRPPTRLKPSEWSEEYRELSRESSSKHGKWHNLPMQIEPMDSVVDPEVQTTVLVWASQTAGKTELVNNIVGFFIHQEPSPMMVLQPTLEMAETWSEDRFDPMVRDTRCLRELVEDKSRNSKNRKLKKRYKGGQLTIAGANSPASLASRPLRINLFDEIDRYPESAGKEGDPILLTEKRSETFWNAVSLKTSTPTIRNHSRIEKEFELSDKRYWFCICPDCGFIQTLKWRQVIIPDGRPQDTYYLCENKDCLSKWDDKKRVKAIRAGYWEATAPFNGIRGYHLNGIYSLFGPKKAYKTKLHQMAAEFLKAKKLGKEAMKVWTNTFLAETWQEESDVRPDWSKLHNRREKYGFPKGIPKGVRIITAGTDFQADRIELEFVGHGEGEESWGLGHHVLWGDPKLPEIYQRLEELLIQDFVRVDGAKLKLAAAGFDTGYAGCQRMLYSWLRPRAVRRYYAFKGSNQRDAEPISYSKKSKVDRVRLLMVGTNRVKSYIYSRATIEAEGPGYMHFPEVYEPEWFKQLLAEESRSEFVMGNEIKLFKMPSVTPDGGTDRNEALDIRVYAQAALYARGALNWEYEEKRNVRTIIQNAAGESAYHNAPPAKEEKPKNGKRRFPGSFVKRLGIRSFSLR